MFTLYWVLWMWKLWHLHNKQGVGQQLQYLTNMHVNTYWAQPFFYEEGNLGGLQ